MGERYQTEKLQVWDTLTPNTAAFPLLPWAPTLRGNSTQNWPFRRYKMQIQFHLLPDPRLKTSTALSMKINRCYSSASASFCQEAETVLWGHRDTPMVLWWHLRTSGCAPQAAGAIALHLPSSLTGQSLASQEAATGGNFGQTEKEKFKIEPSSSLTS